jgi:Uma2 family endonuclease
MSTTVLLSLEEFLARPEREDGQQEELIEGELIVSPGAKVSHAEIVRRFRLLLQPLERMGFVLSNDFGCILRPRSMPHIPDLAAIGVERWNAAAKADAWLEDSPELVIEVSSPSNRKPKLGLKAELYLEHGAEQVWIAYPTTRTVLVCTAEGTTEARIGETLDFRSVRVPVSEIFPA